MILKSIMLKKWETVQQHRVEGETMVLYAHINVFPITFSLDLLLRKDQKSRRVWIAFLIKLTLNSVTDYIFFHLHFAFAVSAKILFDTFVDFILFKYYQFSSLSNNILSVLSWDYCSSEDQSFTFCTWWGTWEGKKSEIAIFKRSHIFLILFFQIVLREPK